MRQEAQNEFPFEFGSYHKEPVIVYDDALPILDELIDVTGVHDITKHVWGRSRYTANTWEEGQARVVIWLLNPQRLPQWARPGHERYPIFKARFNFMEWNEDGDGDSDWSTLEDTPQAGQVLAGGNVWVNG